MTVKILSTFPPESMGKRGHAPEDRGSGTPGSTDLELSS